MTDKPKRKKNPKWTVRKRQWPNGRVYYIVMRGSTEVVVGKSGGVSKYYYRSEAQDCADQMNGVKLRESFEVIE